MNRPDRAVELFQQGLSCSQAVLAAYAETGGLDAATALRVAAGFGGGMGRTANTCGAVTGAVMALGLSQGVASADVKQAKEATYAKVQELIARFQAQHGSITCRDLLHCDISTCEGRKQASDQQLTTTLCPQFVRTAALLLEELTR